MREDVAELKECGARWAAFNKAIKEATEKRDQALWKYIANTVAVLQSRNIRSRRKIRRLVRKTNPSLDAKGASRYSGLLHAIIRKKPKGIAIREWVKSKGGISRCR